MSTMATSEIWDTVSSGYAEVTVPLLQVFSDAALDLIALDPAHRIADIACGPGTLALAAARRVAHVTALDFSKNMIASLKRDMAAKGIDTVDAVVGDGQALPFADGAFDAAFSMFGLMFFPDRAQGFGELRRTLKPGGQVCVSSWAPIAQSSLFLVMVKAAQTVDPDIPDPTYDAASLENPDVLRAEMEKAGFTGVIVHRVVGTAEFASAQAFWTGMEKGAPPIAMMKTSMPPDVWQEKSKAAVTCVDETVGSFPTTLSATALLGIGRKPG
ncbi:MAG: methyltransferase domain-containing protein [Pseudomonadota bacterium]